MDVPMRPSIEQIVKALSRWLRNVRRFFFLRRRRPSHLPGMVDRAVLNTVDATLLEDALGTLRRMLVEIEELSSQLPADATPLGEAARRLVHSSIVECQQPAVDAARLADDIQQVGVIASAMRARVLLSPRRAGEIWIN